MLWSLNECAPWKGNHPTEALVRGGHSQTTTNPGGIRRSKYPNLSLFPPFHLLKSPVIDQSQLEARGQGCLADVVHRLSQLQDREVIQGWGHTAHLYPSSPSLRTNLSCDLLLSLPLLCSSCFHFARLTEHFLR